MVLLRKLMLVFGGCVGSVGIIGLLGFNIELLTDMGVRSAVSIINGGYLTKMLVENFLETFFDRIIYRPPLIKKVSPPLKNKKIAVVHTDI